MQTLNIKTVQSFNEQQYYQKAQKFVEKFLISYHSNNLMLILLAIGLPLFFFLVNFGVK